MKVADILAAKGSVIVSIRPTDSIEALCRLLRERRIGAAVVSADGIGLDGVISERDVAYGLATHKGDLAGLPVSTLMTHSVITCSPTDDVAKVASTMLSRNIRHIPVTDGSRLTGMVSIRDVLGVRLDELQRQTAMLRTLVIAGEHEPQDR